MLNEVTILLESTCIYVSRKIKNDTNREYYIKAMRRCYYVCSNESHGGDLYRARWEINRLIVEASYMCRTRLELFCDSKKYYMMGLNHALDAVNSAIIRFHEGFSYPDQFFADSIINRVKT